MFKILDDVNSQTKANPVLGYGGYTLMRVEDRKTLIKGLAIVEASRFNTHGEVGEIVDISHIDSIDNNIDIAIYFANINGLNALINELELLKSDMIKEFENV